MPNGNMVSVKPSVARVRNLDKLNLPIEVWFRFKPILGNDQTDLKMLKVVKSDTNLIILIISPRLSLNP